MLDCLFVYRGIGARRVHKGLLYKYNRSYCNCSTAREVKKGMTIGKRGSCSYLGGGRASSAAVSPRRARSAPSPFVASYIAPLYSIQCCICIMVAYSPVSIAIAMGGGSCAPLPPSSPRLSFSLQVCMCASD